MNPSAGVSFAWVTVEIALGAWFVLLGGVRKAGSDMLMFGLLAWLTALYGGSFALQNVSPGVLAPLWEALRVSASAFFIAVALDCTMRFGGRRSKGDRLLKVFYVYCFVVSAVALSGKMFLQTRILREVPTLFGSAVYNEAPLNGLGNLLMVPLVVAVVLTTYGFIANAFRVKRSQWGLAVGWLVWLAATINDAFTGIGRFRLPYLLEHANFIFIFTGSYTLISQTTERLRASRADLARTEETLRSLRNTLAEKEHLAAVGELSAIVAHEIRNPLSAIANAVSTLRRAEVAPASRTLLLDIINEECDRMNRIVTDLLTLARPINLQRQSMEIRDLVVRSLGPARREHTEVEVRVSEDAEATFYGDPHLLRQAMENVIDNAVQAMGGGGSLTILVTRGMRAGTEGREISVIDSGEGMNTEVRANARKAFFTTRQTGTGLGLAIVDRIVSAHAGQVEIDSRKGQGTTVRLFLPEVRASDPGEAPPAPPPKASAATR